jgi:protein-tyrosine sulfotransferase
VTAIARAAGVSSMAPAGRPSSAPVIVLAPAYAGASTLRALLDGHPDLACTSGTGLLPLCEQAIATWRNADSRGAGAPSSLASTATRALATSVITAILVREGKSRWCEIAAANPEAAATFLRLYPETRFLCLYRACGGVIRAALDASPWGLADPVLAPFTLKYPANTAASLTAYWITVTGSLLAFEQEHPRSCLRVRFEDLGQGRQAGDGITEFLGLAVPDARPVPDWANSGDEPRPAARDYAAGFPAGLLPPVLLAQANELLGRLDYPQMIAE